jgi:hypothetical protein
MDKVLKWLNYINIIFPQILLHYFMNLQFKFDVYDKNSLSDTKFLKITNLSWHLYIWNIEYKIMF